MRGIDKLHPEVRAKAEELQALCREKGLPVLITETLRTKEEQDVLYAKGRTTPGKIVTNCTYPNSAHCWGVAFDFCRNVRGKEYDTADGFFEKVGQIGKSIGLFWGGDFKSFKDMPHFEHPGYVAGNNVKNLVQQWETPEAFMQNWDTEPQTAYTPQSAAYAESSDNATWRMPEALKKLSPTSAPAVVEQTQPKIESNEETAAWEWAVQRGLTAGIDPHEVITGKTLMYLLRRYDAGW